MNATTCVMAKVSLSIGVSSLQRTNPPDSVLIKLR